MGALSKASVLDLDFFSTSFGGTRRLTIVTFQLPRYDVYLASGAWCAKRNRGRRAFQQQHPAAPRHGGPPEAAPRVGKLLRSASMREYTPENHLAKVRLDASKNLKKA